MVLALLYETKRKHKQSILIIIVQKDIKYARCKICKYGEVHVFWLSVFFPLEVF